MLVHGWLKQWMELIGPGESFAPLLIAVTELQPNQGQCGSVQFGLIRLQVLQAGLTQSWSHALRSHSETQRHWVESGILFFLILCIAAVSRALSRDQSLAHRAQEKWLEAPTAWKEGRRLMRDKDMPSWGAAFLFPWGCRIKTSQILPSYDILHLSWRANISNYPWKPAWCSWTTKNCETLTRWFDKPSSMGWSRTEKQLCWDGEPRKVSVPSITLLCSNEPHSNLVVKAGISLHSFWSPHSLTDKSTTSPSDFTKLAWFNFLRFYFISGEK